MYIDNGWLRTASGIVPPNISATIEIGKTNTGSSTPTAHRHLLSAQAAHAGIQ
jgi:hypothetical protein